ncbi:glycosidase [Sanguibacter keddieii DSM 10542]|uniref:Glycosidase n=1 Tax=Sanguibacter keddieii (strain ATCC 51767 / DSM 10542 / NCFB 3025 / ST-74) TaxID=446469 RepID=D1BD44_SANKS|nr:alpha-glucosidase [Sanguibacter keddieii]ACZ23048.1 glycosidase [Sanguibacter keddieii DSM 10542]
MTRLTPQAQGPAAGTGTSGPGAAPPAWWTRAVVYQVYPRSFADSDGDGVGDLGGILSRLDHLADLGVDVIWLSPVYPSPQHDNGYDISDYEGIDPLFGTLEDFDALLAEVHARGMKLVMDLVVNHTSDQHPWFQESRSSLTSPKRDWYWWRDARTVTESALPVEPAVPVEPAEEPRPVEPNDWRSAFSGPAWTFDEPTGQFYLHLFAPQQPDLNWENPEVRQAVYAMMNRWLDRGVDGFRMDVINLVSKRLEQVDGGAEASGIGFQTGPRLHEFLHEMHEAVFAGRDSDLITVGEMPGITVEEARLVTDPARRELDMVFQFEHVSLDQGADKFDPRPLDLVALKRSLGRWQEGLADVGWNSLYLDNHDQPRLVSRFGDDGAFRYESATLWAALLHLHRGTPYIYQGEEIGMTNVPFTGIDDFRDIESVNYYRENVDELGRPEEEVLAGLRAMSRDNARTPVQWDASPTAGFTTGVPWIPVSPRSVEVNVEADRASERSVFAFYQRLIDLRHTDSTVALGSFTMLEAEHPRLYAFTREGEGDQLLVVGNVSAEPLDVPLLDGWADEELVLGNVPGDARTTTLAPWEVRVHRRTTTLR